MLSTLCWSCKNACAKCSWSRNYKPIKGWIALPSRINNEYHYTYSYIVIKCPLFESDEIKLNKLDICKKYQISDRTYFRWKRLGKLNDKGEKVK